MGQIEAEIDALQRLYIYVKSALPKPAPEPIIMNSAKKLKTDDGSITNNNIPMGASMSKYDVGNINYIKSAIVAKWQIKVFDY